ncbi:hypothetical protein DYB25_006292 [Aphanomyces astaci]|uniref:Uncharacterized protein n=1 Tax=Aphanomyces astaci TaxID=112090 RepID=A0A397BHN8_APHAT|nr:hypothetical protein DYB25_006292 [Aphanomyces astaci]
MTPRNCEYPQELVLELEGTCRLTQIQVLSHQSHIATKVELYLSLDNATYNRLGFLSLKSNKESQYTARELKTVHINSTARFVKFKLHQCYINDKNVYSQVGIVAINLNGEAEEETGPSSSTDEMELGASTPSKPMRASASITPTKASLLPLKPPSPAADDTADLRFDAKTAAKIREIHVAKEKAVAMEDYDQAKRLKVLEQQLMNIGLQLARLEGDKREAVANEDYDAAKRIKDEIMELEASIGMSTTPPTGRSESYGNGGGFPANNRSSSHPPPPQMTTSTYNSTPPPAIPSVSKQRTQQPAEQLQQSYEDETERPLAAASRPPPPLKQQPRSSAAFSTHPDDDLNDAPLRTKPKAPVENAATGGGGGNPHFQGLPDCADLADPEALPDSLLSESAEMVSLIGEYLTTCFYSNVWNHRDAAIRKVALDLTDPAFTDPHDPHVVLSVASTMVQSGVSDRIAQVALSAVALCHGMLQFAETHATLDRDAVVQVVYTVVQNEKSEGFWLGILDWLYMMWYCIYFWGCVRES